MHHSLQLLHDQPQIATQAHWVQLNIGLVRQAGNALVSARHLFAEITPMLDQWRSSGCLSLFFFMRKPPDVRLRFLVSNPEVVVRTLSQHMELLQAQGWIREFFFSEYEPEIDRFGGTITMQYVHHYFDQDTSLWLTYDRLSQQRSALSPETFLPLVFHDLFSRTLIEPHLVFKAWLTLRAWIPTSSAAAIPQIQLVPIATFCQGSTITPEESHLLHGFAAANQQFAEWMSLDANQFTCDLCSILATIALFNFNRYGFSGERSDPLVAAVLHALSRVDSRESAYFV